MADTILRDSKYPLVAVVAMAKNRVIGDGKGLPWHIPQDLKRVKQLTMGKPLIMGRRTYVSIGRSLPGRGNIVLTRNRHWQAEGALPAYSLAEAVGLAEEWIEADATRQKEIIIFGGGEVYQGFMPYISRIEATEIHQVYEGGVAFPEGAFDAQGWQEEARQDFPAQAATPAFSYIRLSRCRKSLSAG